MKGFLVFLVTCVAAVWSSQDVCYASSNSACTGAVGGEGGVDCNALYGGFKEVSTLLQGYANVNLKHSYEYLLFATYFQNYEKTRPGFQKVFKELSDKLWEDSVNLIKHITKRGGKMNFGAKINNKSLQSENPTIELSEIQAMAYALDTQKDLANTAHYIHEHASKSSTHEPEIAQYLEENFMEKQADEIRKLSGYTNDMKNLFKAQTDISLAVFLFDEYLAKA